MRGFCGALAAPTRGFFTTSCGLPNDGVDELNSELFGVRNDRGVDDDCARNVTFSRGVANIDDVRI